LKISIFLLPFSILYASSYPDFKNYEIDDIEENFGKIAKNRIVDYSKTLETLKKFPQDEQLLRVNFYLNQLPFKQDIVNNNNSDQWGTPKEFLTCGYGDCEDYAIIKYFTLLKLGFEKEKLFITTSHEKYSNQAHMVLSYFKSKNEPPLILDSISYKVLGLGKRVDLEAKIFINEEGSYKIDSDNNLVKVGDAPEKFKELLEKIKKES
jgi:predicted transglutaminase-like cysteine proteinase